jgi:glycerol uptake facilitator-like aquaporin
MQHVYGIIFSAAITAFLGAAILYFDYGFWRDTYNRSEIIETKETQKANVTTQSPGDMIGGFLHEASNRIRERRI